MADEPMPQTHAEGAAGVAGYVLEEQVGFLLRRAHQRASAIFQERIPTLTPTQWAALVKIREAGGVSQNRLGRLTAMDAATMQGVVTRLVDRGLVERKPDPADRRRVVLRLSERGRATVDEVIEAARAVSAEILSPLSPREREAVVRLLRRLG